MSTCRVYSNSVHFIAMDAGLFPLSYIHLQQKPEKDIIRGFREALKKYGGSEIGPTLLNHPPTSASDRDKKGKI